MLSHQCTEIVQPCIFLTCTLTVAINPRLTKRGSTGQSVCNQDLLLFQHLHVYSGGLCVVRNVEAHILLGQKYVDIPTSLAVLATLIANRQNQAHRHAVSKDKNECVILKSVCQFVTSHNNVSRSNNVSVTCTPSPHYPM